MIQTANSASQIAARAEGPMVDGDFLRRFVTLNTTALEASYTAEFRCETVALRRLATQLVVLLGRMDDECRALARHVAVAVAQRLDAKHRSELATLARQETAAFERNYLHKYAFESQLEMIHLCQRALIEGEDERVRVAAGRWLQDLRNLINLARELYFRPSC